MLVINKTKKYLTDYPGLMKQFDFDRNTGVDPSKISSGSKIPINWKCFETQFDDHIWTTTPNNRMRNVFGKEIDCDFTCPFCTGRKVCLSNCFMTTHPDLAKELFVFNTLTADEFTYGSHTIVYWFCQNGHIYPATPNSRTSSNDSGCPYCYGRKACFSNCLSATHPHLVLEWASTNLIRIQNITYGSRIIVDWVCPNGHIYPATPNDRTFHDSGCPYCNNTKVCLDNCLFTTHPELALEWASTNILTPYDVTYGSRIVVDWICINGHIYPATPNSRTSKNSGCPHCKESKGKKRIVEYLKELKLLYNREKTFNGCKYKNVLPFDFIVKIGDRKGFMLEYHGEQHYKPCNFGSKTITPEESLAVIQIRDKIKEDYCKNNNIPLLIVPYWDFNRIEESINEFIKTL